MSVHQRAFAVLFFALTTSDRCYAEPDSNYQVLTISQRSIKARLRAEAETSPSPREWFFAAPQPPELDRQTNITARLSPSGRAARELSPQRRPILISRVKDASQKLNIDVEYSIVLLARSLVVRRDGVALSEVPALTPTERAPWLATSPLCAFREPAFQRWLDENGLRKSAEEGVVDFGRRAFEYLRTEFDYEFSSELDRRVMRVCRDKKSDCLGLCVLYVSIMRANDVPARILVGRWAQSSRSGETLGEAVYTKEHVKCEMHAAGVGWIPVDPATAILQPREHVAKRHFGLDTADFVTMHVNDQLVIQPGSSSRRTIPFLQEVYVWVVTDGKSPEIRVRHQWQVEGVVDAPNTRP